MDAVVEAALISAAATLVGVGGTAAVAIVGFRYASKTNRETVEAAKVNTETQVNAALVANRETIDSVREGQLADRYTKAIEQLGSDTIDVSIGGVYALERIARDSPKDHPTVMEVLTACIREHSLEQWPKPAPDGTTRERSTRPDIQAALTVLGRRDTKPACCINGSRRKRSPRRRQQASREGQSPHSVAESPMWTVLTPH